MDFEFIDESEVEYSARGGSREKKEKIDSLFDKPRENRTYWGKELCFDGEMRDDLGTQLAMTLVRMEIRRSVKKMILIDIDDHDLSRRLNIEYRIELRNYQLDVLKEFVMDKHKNVEFVTDEDGTTHILIENC